MTARRAGLRPLGTCLGVGTVLGRVRCAMGASPCYGSPPPGRARRRAGRAARLAGSLACPPTPAAGPGPRRLVRCTLAVERNPLHLLTVLLRVGKVVLVAMVGGGPKHSRSVALQGAGYATQTERMFSDRPLLGILPIFSLRPQSASPVPEYCHGACPGSWGLRSSAASLLPLGGVPPNPLLPGRFAAGNLNATARRQTPRTLRYESAGGPCRALPRRAVFARFVAPDVVSSLTSSPGPRRLDPAPRYYGPACPSSAWARLRHTFTRPAPPPITRLAFRRRLGVVPWLCRLGPAGGAPSSVLELGLCN